MRFDETDVAVDDGTEIHVYHWSPDAVGGLRAIVHIVHGMAEHAARYARFAEQLVAAGYEVYAHDHRGHGKTARSDADLGWFAERDGWKRIVEDAAFLLRHERAVHAGKRMIVFAHSMGSFVAQQLMYEHADVVDAVILSGSNGKPDALASAGRIVARIERARLGRRGRSKLLNDLSFDGFNKPFRPTRTPFDWLSRDTAEVDRYAADPRCGFMVTTHAWVALLDALAVIARPANVARVPKSLPLLVVSGAMDPVGGLSKGVGRLVSAYRAAGLENVTVKLYPDARHELLNEVNRDEVMRDVIAWIGAHGVTASVATSNSEGSQASG